MNKPLEFTIRGITPLICHNGQTADPLNYYSKEMKKISGKRGKTEADLEQLMKLEWFAGLYLKDSKPCIPGEVLEACLTNAAKKTKMGKQAQYGIICRGMFPLSFADENKTLETLFEMDCYRKTCGVVIQRARIIRTRPMFPEWQLTFCLEYDDRVFNEQAVHDIVVRAGQEVGIGDWRPKFGLFEVQQAGV